MTSATTAVLRTEAKLFGRELGSLFWIVAFPAALLCILGAVPSFREPDPSIGGQSAIDLYVPVSVLLSMIMAGLMAMPPVMGGYRERGVLRRLRATPVGPASLLLSQAALHAAATLGAAVLTLTLGRVLFGVDLPGSPLGYAVAYVLALAAVLATGATVTAVSANTRVATVVGSIVFFPTMFTAGVWAPVQTMPDLLRDVVLLTPMGAASEALNDAMLGRFPDVAQLGVMALWVAVLSWLSTRFFRWE